MASTIAKILVTGAQVVGKAFVRAVEQEVRASQQAAKQMRNAKAGQSKMTSPTDTVTGISIQEALQILNLKDLKNLEYLQKNYEHLMKVNEKANGSSVYIQSKVFRAKERIDKEMMEQMKKDRASHNTSGS